MTTRPEVPQPPATGPEYQVVFRTLWDYDPTTGEGTREVYVDTDLTLEQIRASVGEIYWNYALSLSRRFAGKRLIFINSTLVGGGVVIMRKPLIVILRMLGVDAHWYVLAPNDKALQFTKWTVHNGLQGVPGAIPISNTGIANYAHWIDDIEAPALRPALELADVVVIDDWQPSRLIMHMKRWGLRAKIILRDHIQTRGLDMVTPGTLQYPVWDFLYNVNKIRAADLLVTHPRPEFVPGNVPPGKVAFMGATVEPLDELLRPVTLAEIEREKAWIQHRFTAYGHAPLDFSRKYIILVARFDESKFMDGALEYYRRFIERLQARGVTGKDLPQLVLVGNGATDDPSGRKMLALIRRLVRTKYRALARDIHVARFPHRDLAINVLLRFAWIALQPSIAEGFESRVTDAIWLGVPVLGSTEGGIPLQIRPNWSGYVLNPYDFDAWAAKMEELFFNKQLYLQHRHRTLLVAQSHNVRFTTIFNVVAWLTLAVKVLEDPDYCYNQQWADSIPLDGLEHPPVPTLPCAA